MSKPTLLILAAGMASRYGSLKQIDAFGPHGETIIDYSIYDAIQAGFGKVVFIIREEFVDKMREVFDEKLAGKIEVDYAFQSFDLTKFGIDRVIERSKPWGTAHAVMSAKDKINEPFCVINADDFYGSDSFQKMAKFLTTEVSDEKMSLMGFQVGNTMSDYGYVSRGVCEVDEEGHMLSVTERTNIYYTDAADGGRKIVYEENEQQFDLDPKTRVSMNFWGFTPRVFEVAEKMFHGFVEENADNPKSEFFIPSVPDYMVKHGMADFRVIPTSSKWFGVTYKEDKPIVQESISKLIAEGAYPERLF
ncbi:sugar phosphate nucleotidyltransferase [Sphingobacterium psychroaquaticum]|uniref:dTDP-glucose pyrophosphorylase n=1 Tax=Sphingobacterium psychroaquaticum TaxID=561061 RepID=A0A1X7J9U6_9SPHI|nr:sugar phosphate nucleotidyltransferase [Sphingobacterium psychroaquaticum]QBQ39977.1 nucleotidyltransferase [Sphingobacterium psychroaquaticum]SMG24399.1 dTDP-glucose pyrophosphorylase [Sphingobacterium psychroaquaticum]